MLIHNQIIVNTILIILSITCLVLATRAIYIYSYSKSDVLFTIGISMIIVGVSIFVGYLQDSHITQWNAHVSWYAGTIIGIFFPVALSWARSNETIEKIKRLLIIFTAIFTIITLVTPLYPPFSNPYIPVTLNIIRTAIALIGFVRYLALYSKRKTRFTLLMCLAFLLIGAGFGIQTPQLIDITLSTFLAIGDLLRLIGFCILLTAYSLN